MTVPDGSRLMERELEVVVEDDVEIGDPLVVVGIPTLGVVGTITAQYLVDQLEIPEVGGLYSPRFPPVGRVSEGRSSFPVRLHALETRCGLDLTCSHLVVAVTEFLPGPGSLYELAEGLIDWARDADAEMVVLPDGLLVGGEEGSTVRGAASHARGLSTLEKAGVLPLEDGMLAGFSAGVIANGRRRDVTTVSILAESAPDRPDARAAARLVETLDRFIPDIAIETEPLLKQAEQIEEEVRRFRERMEDHAAVPDASYTSMYQ